jgi:hypothetical protein
MNYESTVQLGLLLKSRKAKRKTDRPINPNSFISRCAVAAFMSTIHRGVSAPPVTLPNKESDNWFPTQEAAERQRLRVSQDDKRVHLPFCTIPRTVKKRAPSLAGTNAHIVAGKGMRRQVYPYVYPYMPARHAYPLGRYPVQDMADDYHVIGSQPAPRMWCAASPRCVFGGHLNPTAENVGVGEIGIHFASVHSRNLKRTGIFWSFPAHIPALSSFQREMEPYSLVADEHLRLVINHEYKRQITPADGWHTVKFSRERSTPTRPTLAEYLAAFKVQLFAHGKDGVSGLVLNPLRNNWHARISRTWKDADMRSACLLSFYGLMTSDAGIENLTFAQWDWKADLAMDRRMLEQLHTMPHGPYQISRPEGRPRKYASKAEKQAAYRQRSQTGVS